VHIEVCKVWTLITTVNFCLQASSSGSKDRFTLLEEAQAANKAELNSFRIATESKLDTLISWMTTLQSNLHIMHSFPNPSSTVPVENIIPAVLPEDVPNVSKSDACELTGDFGVYKKGTSHLFTVWIFSCSFNVHQLTVIEILIARLMIITNTLSSSGVGNLWTEDFQEVVKVQSRVDSSVSKLEKPMRGKKLKKVADLLPTDNTQVHHSHYLPPTPKFKHIIRLWFGYFNFFGKNLYSFQVYSI
jgi:hypothetical protein